MGARTEPRAALAALALVALVACSDGDGDPAASSSASGGGGAASSSSSSSGSTGTGSGGEAEWTLVPWWAGTCIFEYANKPENAFPQLEWEPCPGNPPGCERLAKNWPHETPSGLAAPAVRREAAGYMLGLLVVFPGLEQRTVYTDASGRTVAAYRIPPEGTCNATGPALSSAGHWAGAQQIGRRAVSNYGFQPLGQNAAAFVKARTTKTSQEQRGGDELFAIQLDFGSGLEIFDRTTQSVHTTPEKLSAEPPVLVDDAAFFLAIPEYNKPEAWVWTRATGTFTELIDRNPNHVVQIQTDGQTLVWIETPSKAEPGDWPAGTLYTAAYATSAAAVRGTALRQMPAIGPTASSAMGEGYYAVRASSTSYVVVRVGDGQMWTVAIPMDEWRAKLNEVSYVDSTYVFYKTDTHVYRQRLDALGPGEAAGG